MLQDLLIGGLIFFQIPNLLQSQQYFLFSTPRSFIVFQQEWMVVFASEFGIRIGLFHGTRI
jgi:hypothetical protein